MPAAGLAQETTSAINGQVVAEGGKSVANARVSVVHVPSGTRIETKSDANGNFGLRGLRVGGPYTVSVNAAGYAPETIDGLSLTVGDAINVPVQLGTKEIVVTGARIKNRDVVTGSQSSFKSDQIAGVVSARRDVRDIVRRDPLSGFNPQTGGVSIAGGVTRTQRFSIDGVQLQDSFGLNYGGLPSSRGIVSIEMIEQLTVKAAPFDISEGNFQGGAVNVVLKSGTNKLHLSAFGDWGGPSLTGKFTSTVGDIVGNSYPVSATKIQNFKNYGGSISGPIIPNRLFFSASYEKLNEGTPNPFGIAGTGAPNIVSNVNLTDTQIAAGATLPGTTTPYGYSAGAFTIAGINAIQAIDKAVYQPIDGAFPIGDIPVSIAEKDEKYAGKLDWNITTGQRLTASYIHHVNVLPQYVGGSASVQSPNIALQSYDYQLTEHTDAESVQLNSKWTDHFSTELRASYKYYRRGQDSYNGTNFAAFQVCADPTAAGSFFSCSTGSPTIFFGPDAPRQANKFNSHTLNLQGNATYTASSHSFKLDVDHYYSKLYNLFVFPGGAGPQGLYYFDSIADYQNRVASELKYGNSTTGSKNDGYVNWAYSINTIGIQDTWKLRPNLTLTGGWRYDRYSADNSIQKNQNFFNRYGFYNTATLDGRSKFQPRFGFNWLASDSIRLVGGVGLFAGGLSDVFVSNNYSNSGAAINSTGAILNNIDLQRSTLNADGCIDAANTIRNFDPGAAVCAALKGVTGSTVNAAAQNYLANNLGSLASALTNTLDPNFKIPAQWKYNLSFTARPDLSNMGLGKGWTLKADALFSDTQVAPRWTDLRAQPLVINGVTQVTPDGRPRYNNSVGSNYDIQLSNTKKGQTRVFAVGIQKEFDSGLSLNASYTHQNVKDVAGILISSTVGSAYGSVATADPNSGGAYGRSIFEVTNQERLGIDYRFSLFKGFETRVGLSGEFRSGAPYSLTFVDGTTAGTAPGRGPTFGTVQNNGEFLFYVPDLTQSPITNASTTQGVAGGLTQYGNVIFADAATLAAVQNLIGAANIGKYQGQIIPKNTQTGPGYSKVDFHFAQQVPFFHNSHFTALLDIENVLNMLNSNWGTFKSFGDQSVVRVTCQTPAAGATQACPNYVYSVANVNSKSTALAKFSLYAIRFGVRFDF
jgi:hypothetical protein